MTVINNLPIILTRKDNGVKETFSIWDILKNIKQLDKTNNSIRLNEVEYTITGLIDADETEAVLVYAPTEANLIAIAGDKTHTDTVTQAIPINHYIAGALYKIVTKDLKFDANGIFIDIMVNGIVINRLNLPAAKSGTLAMGEYIIPFGYYQTEQMKDAIYAKDIDVYFSGNVSAGNKLNFSQGAFELWLITKEFPSTVY